MLDPSRDVANSDLVGIGRGTLRGSLRDHTNPSV